MTLFKKLISLFARVGCIAKYRKQLEKIAEELSVKEGKQLQISLSSDHTSAELKTFDGAIIAKVRAYKGEGSDGNDLLRIACNLSIESETVFSKVFSKPFGKGPRIEFMAV